MKAILIRLLSRLKRVVSPLRGVNKLAVMALTPRHEVYDPFQDEDKIMKGEVESYFD